MSSAYTADTTGLLVACGQCGRRNRLRYATLTSRTRCGACHTDLPAPDVPIELPTAAAFEALTQHSALPVLIDFWAAWCGPCRVVAPHVAEVARRMAGTLLVGKLDTDAVPDVAGRFSIRSIPTLAVLVQRREVQRMSGAAGADDLERFVRGAI